MSGSATASYVYDADGNRVKETIGPTFGHELHESKRKGPGIRENSVVSTNILNRIRAAAPR